MATTFDSILDISPLKQTWRIVVRVIRLWTTPGFNYHGEVNSMEMVLEDKEGGRIHGHVKRYFVKNFIKTLHEGKVYEISQFDVQPNTSSFRSARHTFKIHFQYSTRVKERVDDQSISKYGLMLFEFDEILSRVVDANYLVDVLGKIAAYHPMEELKNQAKEGKMTKKMILYLEDLENRKLSCTFWDEYAETVNAYISKNNDGPAVLLLQWCKIKDDQGFSKPRKLSKSLYATRLFINYDIPESIEFRKKLLDESAPILHGGTGSNLFFDKITIFIMMILTLKIDVYLLIG